MSTFINDKVVLDLVFVVTALFCAFILGKAVNYIWPKKTIGSPTIGDGWVLHKSIDSLPTGTYDVYPIQDEPDLVTLVAHNPRTSWLTGNTHKIYANELPSIFFGEICTITIFRSSSISES